MKGKLRKRDNFNYLLLANYSGDVVCLEAHTER